MYQYVKGKLVYGHMVLFMVACTSTFAFAATAATYTKRDELELSRCLEQLRRLLLAGAVSLVLAIVTSRAFVKRRTPATA